MVPKRIMTELLVIGEPMNAARAYEVGLVNLVVPPDQLLTRAVAMAEQICANASLSVMAAKELVRVASEVGRTEALALGDAIYDLVYRSADALEGPRAFAERREPVWSAR
jgi:enoyl-CoA hydratase